ncbi:hypothetical protein VTK73DRAFT_8464 [Phialemonium thermophilum]|uniref:Nephrocystin 3-like N-terminal domain-containing protein n=1 Tax=Phialemonium thermophilum TaxID=223376 RepID=A0ABR3W8D3_9PEZI
MMITALLVSLIIVLVSLCLPPILARIRRPRATPRSVLATIAEPATTADFDIVAIHGLGADPEHTWSCTADPDNDDRSWIQKLCRTAREPSSERRRVPLLRHLLRSDFANARILCFTYYSGWLVNGQVTTAATKGTELLDQLAAVRLNRPATPIVFVAHSFGGIALTIPSEEAREILRHTQGILFLGTPHQGSRHSAYGATAASLGRVLGSEPALLLALKSNDRGLSDLDRRFRMAMAENERAGTRTRLFCFHESLPTFLGWLNLGIIVERNSAHTSDAEEIEVAATHSGLNKCRSKSDPLYRELRRVVEELTRHSEPTLNADQQAVIRRLSSRTLDDVAYNSARSAAKRRCCPDTRVDVLRQIREWADDPDGKPVFLLQGMAGTGKSTICRTICDELSDEGRLGASFFFDRENDSGRQGKCFTTTIAAQLVGKLPVLSHAMRVAMDAHSDLVLNDNKRQQFEKLVVHPLRQTCTLNPDRPRPVLVAIDALDECVSDGDIDDILWCLSEAADVVGSPLRFFVTSRPEVAVRHGFGEGKLRSKYLSVSLQEAEENVTRTDISTFLRERFREMKDRFEDLPEQWPEEEDFQCLLSLTCPLFIAAETACLFIENPRNPGGGPANRLRNILDSKTKGHVSPLHRIYLFVLNQLLLGVSEPEEALQEVKEILGPVVLLLEPPSIKLIAALLGRPESSIHSKLSFLHSIIDVPASSSLPVRLLHNSFRDFLIGPGKEHPFQVDEAEVHRHLGQQCLTFLDRRLQENIYHFDSPVAGDPELIDYESLLPRARHSRKRRELDEVVEYASLFWAAHSQKGRGKMQDGGPEHIFLKGHFLHWIELLSLTRSIFGLGGSTIRDLRRSVQPDAGHLLSAFLRDAMRVLRQNNSVLARAPLQAYSSVLAFSCKTSPIREALHAQLEPWILQGPRVEESWTECLRWSPAFNARVIAISADLSRIFAFDRNKFIA